MEKENPKNLTQLSKQAPITRRANKLLIESFLKERSLNPRFCVPHREILWMPLYLSIPLQHLRCPLTLVH